MKGRGIGQRGMTLMEIVIVLAVLAILVALLTPLVFTYIEDARKNQAQADANSYAAAIVKFMKDTGLPPYKGADTAVHNPKYDATTDFSCLISDGTLPVGLASQWDTTAATGTVKCDGTVGTAAGADLIENHLIKNAPAGSTAKSYTESGKNAWRGPYLPSAPKDPWGQAYLVNIKNADPGSGKAVIVISAGPDGGIDTASNTDAKSSVSPTDDDLIARVK